MGADIPTTPSKRKKWTFIRKFRWAVYLAFIAVMVFVAVCLAVGIISNLRWRHDDLDVPVDRPESLSDLGSLELRDCLSALEKMRLELDERLYAAISGREDRDAFWAAWKKWSRDWRKRFEQLGVSCRLTEYRYDTHPTLGLLAKIYDLLDYFHRHHDRLVKRFVTENARPLRQLRGLFHRAGLKIEQLEGQPLGQEP